MAWVTTSIPEAAVRPFRGGHAVVGVDDSHVGEQRVVGERPLDAGLLVGDDGERRALSEPVPEEVGTATK